MGREFNTASCGRPALRSSTVEFHGRPLLGVLAVNQGVDGRQRSRRRETLEPRHRGVAMFVIRRIRRGKWERLLRIILALSRRRMFSLVADESVGEQTSQRRCDYEQL